jgi:MFS family permease
VAISAVGWGLFSWIMPPYAQEVIGIRPQWIGLLLLANAITVVVVQVPVAKFAEGRRRVLMIVLAASIFTAACLLAVLAGLRREIAYAALLIASIAVAFGECFYTAVLTPLIADMAPAALRGRYMASMGLSWWIGLALAPTFGTQILSIAPAAVFVFGAALATVSAVSALALEKQLPESARLTPHPQGPMQSSTPSVKTH